MPFVAESGSWSVYILRCGDGALYTGIAKDVRARVVAHNLGKGARFTRSRRPVELLIQMKCGAHGDALRVEMAIKKRPRTVKVELTESRAKLRSLVRSVKGRAARVAKTAPARPRKARA